MDLATEAKMQPQILSNIPTHSPELRFPRRCPAITHQVSTLSP